MKKLGLRLIMAAITAAVIFSGCGQVGENALDNAYASVDTVDLLESPFCFIENTSDSEDVTVNEEGALTEEEVELIALLTMAEAEDECETGKRLVIDVVLNRIDAEEFPDNAFGVIFEPYQFPSMTNGRADECEIDDDICRLVREEEKDRLNSECLYFNSDGYFSWAKPLFKVQGHYFSGEEREKEE